MYQVFNMGHRMELYVPEAIAADLGDVDFEAVKEKASYITPSTNGMSLGE